jgi:hypothetical protein
MRKDEMLRRLRLGDMRRYYRHRYGHTLPDDDAGREDLYELLLPISLGTEPERKMQNAVQIWAPWMRSDEAGQLFDRINRTPCHMRKPTARELGERLNLKNHERDALAIRTIAAIDLTPEQLRERRKARGRNRSRRRRRSAGSRPREIYLTNSLSRKKPWETKGISRATWYRQHRDRIEISPTAEQERVRQVRP